MKDPSKIDETDKARTKLNKMTINSGKLIVGISILGLIVVIGASIVSRNLFMGILGAFIFVSLLLFGYCLLKFGQKEEHKVTQNIGAKIAKIKEAEHQNKHSQFIGKYSMEHTKHSRKKRAAQSHHTHKKHCMECGKMMVKRAKYCPDCGMKQ